MRCIDSSPGFFDAVNEAIFKEITSRAETPIIDGEKLDSLVWWERIRRTYHLSSNHLMAMLDMADFVYTGENEHLAVTDTPLGLSLIKRRGRRGMPAVPEKLAARAPQGFDSYLSPDRRARHDGRAGQGAGEGRSGPP